MIDLPLWESPGALPELGGDVHAWRASVSAAAPFEAQLLRSLSRDELDRAGRFHFQRDRVQYIVAHAMLRCVIARYAHAAAASLDFDTGPFGKPSLRGDSPLEFNMSHSADVVIVAVTWGRRVGVDVEQWSESVEVESLAQTVFSPAESAYVLDQGAAERVPAFFQVWSRKEAYIKATGDGVSRGLDHFDVPLAPGGGSITDRQVAEASNQWMLRDLSMECGYSGAVVAAGLDWQVRRLLWNPSAAAAALACSLPEPPGSERRGAGA